MKERGVLGPTTVIMWTVPLASPQHGTYTLRSCSRHGVVAARLTPASMARQHCTSFKNIYSVSGTFLVSPTVGVF